MIQQLRGFFSRRIVRVGIGILISAASLYLAFRGIEISDVMAVLSQAAWEMVLLALIATSMTSMLKALRWRFLLEPAQKRISYYNTLMSFMVGQVFNALFPARAGELSRIYIVGEMGISRAFVVGTIFLEKILDMISYTLLIIWMLVWIPHPAWLSQSGWAFALATFVFLTALLVMFFRKREFLGWLKKKSGRLPAPMGAYGIDQVQTGLNSISILESKGSLVVLGTITFGIWTMAVLTNFLTFQAVDIDMPVAGAVVLLIILQAGIALPAVPGNFGVFEYACILALAIFGVSQEVALSYGLLLHAIVLLPVIISGLLSLWLFGLKDKDWKKLRQPYDQMEKPD